MLQKTCRILHVSCLDPIEHEIQVAFYSIGTIGLETDPRVICLDRTSLSGFTNFHISRIDPFSPRPVILLLTTFPILEPRPVFPSGFAQFLQDSQPYDKTMLNSDAKSHPCSEGSTLLESHHISKQLCDSGKHCWMARDRCSCDCEN